MVWLMVGLGMSAFYDRRSLDRIAPGLLEFVNLTVDRAVAERKAAN